MKAPRFLSVEVVLQLHEEAIARFGGSSGFRNETGFASAVVQAQQVYYYQKTSLFEIAAVYAFHLAEAQAFVDGNKRTAVAAALVFLECNGYQLTGNSMKLYDAMIAIAKKQIGKPELAQLLEDLTSPI